MRNMIVQTALEHFPQMQAIYLFGSQADNTTHPESDIDIAILLPHKETRNSGELSQSQLRFSLEKKLNKTVDLINLRLASTVFQNEICQNGIRLHCSNEYETDSFEMMVLSSYCKLNDEREGILQSIISSKRIYNI